MSVKIQDARCCLRCKYYRGDPWDQAESCYIWRRFIRPYNVCRRFSYKIKTYRNDLVERGYD